MSAKSFPSRDALVEAWKKNAIETIQEMWVEEGCLSDPSEKNIQKVLDYVVNRCVGEGLTEDFVILNGNGEPQIDRDLVGEAFEVWNLDLSDLPDSVPGSKDIVS